MNSLRRNLLPSPTIDPVPASVALTFVRNRYRVYLWYRVTVKGPPFGEELPLRSTLVVGLENVDFLSDRIEEMKKYVYVFTLYNIF